MDSKASFLGKYRLQRELGRGGMAVVHEAVDTELGRRVAVKVLHARPDATPEQARVDEERFLREARLASALPKHPGIVGVHDAGMHEGRRYMVMELIDGRPFADWRKEAKPLLPRQIEALRDVALAVHHAHEHGVVHRDLKPANILVDAENRPHVTDFGLAKLDTGSSVSLTGDGLTVGTPGYMSPEQAQGLRSVDRKTDVYSLGILLYEMIAGQTPFQGESAIAILTQVIRDPIKPPSTILKGQPLTSIDLDLERICLKAVAKEVEDRTPTAKEFADRLTDWLEGRKGVLDLPRANGLPGWPWWLAVAATGAAVLAFAFRAEAPRPSKRIELDAREAWTDTGLEMREGEIWEAAGEGTWGNNPGSAYRVGADGGEPYYGTTFEGYARTAPVPSGRVMALLGRIGPAGEPWIFPTGRPVRMPAGGRLRLGPNDAPTTDNSGAVTVLLQPGKLEGSLHESLQVAARAAWTDTGVDVREGDPLRFVALGDWSNDPSLPPVGAGGRAPGAKPDPQFPMPTAGSMTLVGRIGAGRAWIAPLGETPLRAPAAGRLYLGPNDFPVTNNRGLLTVRLHVR